MSAERSESSCEKRTSKTTRSLVFLIAKHLIITFSILGLIAFNVLGPYYLTFVRPRDPQMSLGVHYYFDDIPLDLQLINETGFRTVKIDFNWDGVENSLSTNQTQQFYNLTAYYGLKTALIVLPQSFHLLNDYLRKWGSHIQYVQALNEPELMKGWGEGALLLDGEIEVVAAPIVNETRSQNLNISLYVNFSPAFLLRPTIVTLYDKMGIDFVGLDVYMESGLQLTPFFYSLLQDLSNRKAIVSEFGISTFDENKKANFIIEGLDFFKKYGIDECWLVYWNGVGYGIRGTISQASIKEWVQSNVS